MNIPIYGGGFTRGECRSLRVCVRSDRQSDRLDGDSTVGAVGPTKGTVHSELHLCFADRLSLL